MNQNLLQGGNEFSGFAKVINLTGQINNIKSTITAAQEGYENISNDPKGASLNYAATLTGLDDDDVVKEFDAQDLFNKLQGPKYVRIIGLALGLCFLVVSTFDIINIFQAVAFISYATKILLWCFAGGVIAIEAVAFDRLQFVRDFLTEWVRFSTVLAGRGLLYIVFGLVSIGLGGVYFILGFASFLLGALCLFLHWKINYDHLENGFAAHLNKIKQTSTESVASIMGGAGEDAWKQKDDVLNRLKNIMNIKQ